MLLCLADEMAVIMLDLTNKLDVGLPSWATGVADSPEMPIVTDLHILVFWSPDAIIDIDCFNSLAQFRHIDGIGLSITKMWVVNLALLGLRWLPISRTFRRISVRTALVATISFNCWRTGTFDLVVATDKRHRVRIH